MENAISGLELHLAAIQNCTNGHRRAPVGASHDEKVSNDPQIALVGVGIMGHWMLTNMIAAGGFGLVGGWDPSPAARRGFS